ncbi:MAG TPA: hypothetical protein VFS39_12925 [Nitrospira sp.]|nr:hypothetical protein [Nitrospira sp.]
MGIPADWEAAAGRAKEAARQGRWTDVGEYYARRQAWIGRVQLPEAIAVRLAVLDREIESMAAVARAAAQALLHEAITARRAFARLRATLEGAAAVWPAAISRRS